MELNFRSDNESPAAPEIFAALAAANRGSAWSYAEDTLSLQLDAAFTTLFGTPTTVLPLSTGTAANSIALASVTPPWGSVFCHDGAHIVSDEGGAPEFFGNGLRLVGIAGANGKLQAASLQAAVQRHSGHGIHSYQATALSLTQSSEAGTVYAIEEVSDLCTSAHQLGLVTHMDGARFANAVVALGCTPAATTWQAGVDLLSFGASKNGCLAAEALLIFGASAWQERAERLRKRSGHLLSKMRYVAAQLLAYIEQDLWLRLAAHANRQAARFAATVERHPSAALEYNVDANEVFVRWNKAGFDALSAAGIQFLGWPGRDDLARFVFSHATPEQETAVLCDTLLALSGEAP